MVHDNDALAEFAGTGQSARKVVIENDSGKPVRILDVRGANWRFDGMG